MEKQVASFLSNPLSLPSKVAFLQGSTNFGLTLEESQFLQAHVGAIKLFRSVNELVALPLEKESFDLVLVGKGFTYPPPANSEARAWFFQVVLAALVPSGRVQFLAPGPGLEVDALLGGMINPTTSLSVFTCEKPSYKPALLLPKAKKPTPAVVVAEDIIDEDALLEEDCEQASMPLDANVVVAKRACKNCTCGLKEAQVVLDVTAGNEQDAVQEQAPAGCGGCSRGDAFRCGGCPYLGTPAFTPGTKPEIVVKDDGSKTLVQIDLGQAEF
ncbi:hypothetical protein BASA81_002678 [Batrachochytrium salamandrivorans]|nr:hypothetical protein BASA81_002678 [Batrachochytrium salamandrivorans]